MIEDRHVQPDRLFRQRLHHEARRAGATARRAPDLVMVGLIAQHASEAVLRDRQPHELQGRQRARAIPPLRCRPCPRPSRRPRRARRPSPLKSSPRPAPLAVWSVCLSEPEQADVPPKALWVTTTTSSSRRFISTAARNPAAPLPRTSASPRWRGIEKPRATTVSFADLSVARRGISMSVRASRMPWGIVALKGRGPEMGIDGAERTSYRDISTFQT